MGRYPLLLFAVAFAVRALLVLALRDPMRGPDPAGPGGPTADDVEFDTLARHVAGGEGFTSKDGVHTSFRAPGWPLLLAGVYACIGTHPLIVYALNCLLGALSCLLAYLLARELFAGADARKAGWLAAFFLPHAWFATLYYSENLFAPLLGGAALLVMRRHGLAAGLLLGAAILTRPFALLLVPLWAVAMLWRPKGADGAKGSYLSAGLLVVGAAAVVAPWTLRNHAVHGEWVLVATNGGSTFYGGNNDRVVREWRLWGSWVSTIDLPRRAERDEEPTEALRDKAEWRFGKEWLIAHPGEAALLMPLKLLRLVFWLPDFDAGRINFAVRVICFAPYLVLLLIGLTRVPWRDPAWWPTHAVLVATVLTALIFWGSPRFRDANLPVLMLYACAGLARPEKRT